MKFLYVIFLASLFLACTDQSSQELEGQTRNKTSSIESYEYVWEHDFHGNIRKIQDQYLIEDGFILGVKFAKKTDEWRIPKINKRSFEVLEESDTGISISVSNTGTETEQSFWSISQKPSSTDPARTYMKIEYSENGRDLIDTWLKGNELQYKYFKAMLNFIESQDDTHLLFEAIRNNDIEKAKNQLLAGAWVGAYNMRYKATASKYAFQNKVSDEMYLLLYSYEPNGFVDRGVFKAMSGPAKLKALSMDQLWPESATYKWMKCLQSECGKLSEDELIQLSNGWVPVVIKTNRPATDITNVVQYLIERKFFKLTKLVLDRSGADKNTIMELNSELESYVKK
ncbi:hypothetical protein [Thalassolituus sp.]|jgi:hypothetical protein|uniref:hypothetical protein n=1 Tax=Thalassolituus sp. TaxID=2030822 RepID=UPI0032D989DF